MRQRPGANRLILCVAAGCAALGSIGCHDDPGPNRAPTAKDMQADKSNLTPDQQKMMQEGMKRDAEKMKPGSAASSASTNPGTNQ